MRVQTQGLEYVLASLKAMPHVVSIGYLRSGAYDVFIVFNGGKEEMDQVKRLPIAQFLILPIEQVVK